MEHQRLSDLVLVNYKFHLKCRYYINFTKNLVPNFIFICSLSSYLLYTLFWWRRQYKKRSYDLVDQDSIDKMDFWIAEDEEAKLVDGDMREAIYGEDATPTLDESHDQG